MRAVSVSGEKNGISFRNGTVLPISTCKHAILTCLEERKFASSAHEFFNPLQFQEMIPTGGSDGVEGCRDAEADDGPGLG